MTLIFDDVCHVRQIDYFADFSNIKMEFKIFSFIALYLLLNPVCGLYFHIAEGERKCFIEEIPDDTTVLGIFCLVLILMINCTFDFLG